MNTLQKVSAFFETYPQRTYAKHELLLHAEEPVATVFYLYKGRVSQYDIAPNGNEVVVNIFKPGAFFPMSSVINNTDNHYFFEASLDTTVRLAPAADAVRFLRDNPDVAFDLLTRVYRGVDGVLRRMAHLMGGDATSRLVFELLNAAYRFGEQQPNGDTLILVTENEIAKRSGLARETVSRLLQELKAAGLIKTIRGGLLVPSLPGLEAKLGTGL